MRLNVYFYVLILLTTLHPNMVKAQSGENKPVAIVWTLQQCINYAGQNNIQINTLRLNQQLVMQDLIATKGLQIPSLSASVGNQFNNANNNAVGNGSLVNQLTNSGTYAINSSVVLWNDHTISNTIHQQELINQSAGLSVQQSQNNITLAITQAYLNILLAKENLKYVTDLVATSDSSVKHGQQLLIAGSIAKVAVLQLQAQLATDKYLLVQTQNAIRQNTLLLKQLLQIRTDDVFEISADDTITVNNLLNPLQDVQQAALNNFPDSKIGKLGVDIASIEIANAKAAFKPVLKANGSLGSGYSDVLLNNVSPKTGYFTQTSNKFYQNIGLSLSIPIFSQRANKTNLQKSTIAYQQANLNLENTRLGLSQAVEQAYLNAAIALQSYDAANVQLQAAIESYRIGNAEFKLGSINSYDLLQQRNQYVQAVQAYTQAKYSAVLQYKIYEFYLGNPVTL